MFLNGGYFSAPVSLEGVSELAKFARAAVPYLKLAGADQAQQILGALPSETGQNCLDQEATFTAGLSNKKQVACFARSEMRGMKATVTVDNKTSTYMKSVLKILRDREAATLAKLDSVTKNQLKYYLDSHFSERRRVADLRSLAFSLSKQLCDIYAQGGANDPRLLIENENKYISTDLCKASPLGGTIRDLILSEIRKTSVLPEQDYLMMKKYFDDTTTPFATLRQQTEGCSNFDVNNITVPAENLTPCDMGWIGTKLWATFVDESMPLGSSGPLADASLFGFTSDTYLSLVTTAAQTATQKAQDVRGLPRILPLNTNTVLKFGFKLDGQYGNTMLIHYDATAQGLFPAKGDSGSMLSVFGYYPMGLLSTVDGEKTSGGASILPLPEVGEEASTVPVSNAGC